MDRLMLEVESYGWMETHLLPGELGIHEVQIAPFELPSLPSSNWYKMLNLTKPLENVSATSRVKRAAVLEDFSPETNPYGSSPTSHWVFVTSIPWISQP
jgi:hypothetical protein